MSVSRAPVRLADGGEAEVAAAEAAAAAETQRTSFATSAPKRDISPEIVPRILLTTSSATIVTRWVTTPGSAPTKKKRDVEIDAISIHQSFR